jgi:hypothetical protein
MSLPVVALIKEADIQKRLADENSEGDLGVLCSRRS